ncbi:MAG TPA: YciI family protein [Bryobacteraceae bacterium]|nr:YciI family protein [Bryobacteraceae bacterium]
MRASCILTLLFLVVHTAGAQQAASDTTSKPNGKSTYLVVYKPGPKWISGKPLAEQPLGEHGRYMASLYSKGDLKIAGPFTDGSGGALVVNASDEAAAKSIVMKDPAVVSGVFVYELHPWGLVDWESLIKK